MSTLETGGCSCGAVRYEVSVKPLIVHCCHCTDCQRLTGSAFAVNAMVEADKVRVISGEVAIDSLPTPSGRPQDLYHCPQCSGSLWSDYGQRGYIYFLHTGTLDRPDAFKPDVHIFAKIDVHKTSLGGRAKSAAITHNVGCPLLRYKSGKPPMANRFQNIRYCGTICRDSKALSHSLCARWAARLCHTHFRGHQAQ
jgi:hypothetical protein